MKKFMLKKITEIIMVATVFCFVIGCGPKNPKDTAHIESGYSLDIVEQISNDCTKNKDVQGAKEAWDTYLYLLAFRCNAEVKYDDVKNRKFENIEYDIGDLQLALAAYNEYNEESAMDVEVDWICQYNSCTQEQREAINSYVEWWHTQKGNVEIEDYKKAFNSTYDDIKSTSDLTNAPPYDKLTPAQFKEVQNYMADPENYQVDISVWE